MGRSMARCPLGWLLVMVAVATALPGNYAPAATYTGESSGALDRVIQEQPSAEVLLAGTSKGAPTDQFKDDPLTESVSESFMNAVKSLASKTPSLPISKGFKNVQAETEDVVKHESKVDPVGATQAAAEKAGKTIAAKIAKTKAETPAPGTPHYKGEGKTKSPNAATKPTKQSGVSVAAKAAVKPNVRSAKVTVNTKENSASAGCGVTFVTVGLAAMTVLVAGSM